MGDGLRCGRRYPPRAASGEYPVGRRPWYDIRDMCPQGQVLGAKGSDRRSEVGGREKEWRLNLVELIWMGVLGPGGWEREWRDFERDKEGMRVRRGFGGKEMNGGSGQGERGE